MNTLPDRTEPFLALTEEGDRLRGAVIQATARLWSQATAGFDISTFTQMDSPEVGDLVLEVTRARWTKDERLRRGGLRYLVFADPQAGNYQIQYGQASDDVCGWSGCMLIKVTDEALDLAEVITARQ